MGNSTTLEYFATLKGQEFLDAVTDKLNTYRDTCKSNGQLARWQLSLGSYYGISPEGKNSWRVSPQGEYGELIGFKVNDYASLLRQELQIAVQNRPAGIAKAINSDIKTLRDARIGSQFVEYFLSDPTHNFEEDYVEQMRLVLSVSEGFCVQDWETEQGLPTRPDENGKVLKTGDLVQAIYPPWNAARDVGAPSPEQPWYIFSKRINKWWLCAKFPDLADQIKTLGHGTTAASGVRKPLLFDPVYADTDYIEMHKFIHFPSGELEHGRYTWFLDGLLLPIDGDYPYPCKNVHRASEQDMIETAFAHTSNYDLLALEQVTDMLHSVVVNNQSTFGVATIVGPKGAGINHLELAKGLRYMEVDAQFVDKIKPLQLTATPAEVFKYLDALGVKKGEISAINSILRGDPAGALKGASGAAMALLQSNAIAANGGVQRAYYKLLNAAGTGIIEMSRKFTDEPRLVRIAGKANSQAVKEFKVDKDTLNSISTVIFEPVNPLLQTASGKLTIAQDMLHAGMISSPKRYIEVLTTGNLNVLLEDDVAMQEAIIEENELLGEGQSVQAIISEKHQEHIAGHQAVIAMPNAKKDPKIIAGVLAHIQEHLDLWTKASRENPALLAATGQQVLPQSAPPQGIPAPPPPTGPSGVAPVSNPNSNQPNLPNLPKPPVNPHTREPAPVAPGTPVQQPRS